MSNSGGLMRAWYWLLLEEVHEWWHALLRPIPGRIGRKARAWAWRRALEACGSQPVIMEHVVFNMPQFIRLGDNIAISRYVQMQGAGGITIGSNVLIGPNVLIWSSNHVFSDPNRPIALQGYVEGPVVIEDDVWVAGGAIILPNAHIGKGSVIGAGSIVIGEIPPGVVAAGDPAVVKKRRGENAQRPEAGLALGSAPTARPRHAAPGGYKEDVNGG